MIFFKKKKTALWRKWFAWYPVRLEKTLDIVWMEYVLMRYKEYDTFIDSTVPYTAYRREYMPMPKATPSSI